MNPTIDLHIHTTYSDGLSTPSEILEIVREKKLSAFAICDHDNFGALQEFEKLLKPDDPELISGIELSAGQGGEDIHILGYMYNRQSQYFADTVEQFRNNRNHRGALMLKELEKLGIDIPMEMVREIAGDSAIGRPHIADALVRVGAVKKFSEAFDRLIGYDGPAYVPKKNLTPKEAIELIHKADGLAFLAHPGICDVARYIGEFKEYGLDGIEIYHPAHNRSIKKSLKKLAQKESLMISGGSDFHGREGHHEMIGSQSVPAELLDLIKQKMNLK
ncbi:MAG: PHP domain-containing protein [Candidatus Zixiibacteriota bacterium]